MKQHQFEAKHQALWQRFEHLLMTKKSQRKAKRQAERKTKKNKINHQKNYEQNAASTTSEFGYQPSNDLATDNPSINPQSHKENRVAQQGYEFVNLYRVICQHYALAKQRHYSPQLVLYLQDLVIKGHQKLYHHQSHIWSNIYHFFRYTFPIRLRHNAGLFWLSLLCCLVPAILMGWACYEQSDMIYSLMSEGQVRMMEQMYNPANDMIGRKSERRSDTDIMMFGYYIRNNIGIDFQTYGSGIFAGIGTLFILLYNGLIFGAVGGHLSAIGFGSTFWPFVSGHGSFELTAMVISGAAGLRLAQALFMPGNYSRLDAFKIAGKQSIELLIGAAVMTFIAAFIEAFWSSSSVIPDLVKYIVAALLWALVIGYLVFAGRRYEREVMGVAAYKNTKRGKLKASKPLYTTGTTGNEAKTALNGKPQQGIKP